MNYSFLPGHLYQYVAIIFSISVTATILISLIFPDAVFVALLLHFILLSALSFSLLQTVKQLLKRSRRNYGGVCKTKKRVLSAVMPVSIASAIVSLLYIFITSRSGVFEYADWHLKSTLSFALFFLFTAFLYGGINELIYFYQHREKHISETEHLLRENLQTRFESLKNQVNPHFLFNSLNSLRSLIEDDAGKAEQFVIRLSNVYRYLLQENDKELTALSSELDFIKSYFYILNTRFNFGLRENIDVPEKYAEWQLPPLTLQLLVENAVKHNVISPARPLKITISVNDKNELIVTNNLQRKTQAVLSNGIGLENITVKYRLLNQGEIVVNETDENFEVRLPLINKNCSIIAPTSQLTNL